MTLFQHTLGQLLRGEKTETSRLALPLADGEHIVGREMIQYPMGNKAVMRGTPHGWRLKWQVGRNYAIQPARGMKSVGQYRVLDVWQQDVRTLTREQAEAEGFAWPTPWTDFMQVWMKMHDASRQFYLGEDAFYHYNRGKGYGWQIAQLIDLIDMINHRPDEHYQAWRMKIEVLWDTVDWDSQYVRHLGLNPMHVGTIQIRNGFTHG